MTFIDLHTDTPLKIYKGQECAADYTKQSFDFYLQNMAIWLSDSDPEPKRTYENTLTAFKNYAQENNINITKNFKSSGAFLSVENAGFLANDPWYLEKMYNDGVRIISLAWNGQSPLAGGCQSKASLSNKAIKIIERMNAYRIALDISHLNEESALSAIELSKFPLATHSNCKEVSNHPRNLSDRVLLALKEKGGIVGLCLYPEFLGGDVFSRLYENICRLIYLGMEKNIAIGSDFDGAEMDRRLSKTEDIKTLHSFLKDKGLEKSIIDGIFFENALAFFDKICNN